MKRLVAVALTAAALTCVTATPAGAHPLGNFSVNHYHGLLLTPDRIEDHAVVDTAEIPTMQAYPDGVPDTAARAVAAAGGCRDLATAVSLRVDGAAVAWSVEQSSLVYQAGAAGLQTSRLECRLAAGISLHTPAHVDVDDGYRADRVGWHEITAAGQGVRIDTPVRRASVSGELQTYPKDLLASPPDERSVRLHTSPGPGAVSYAEPSLLPAGGFFARLLGTITATFNDLVGQRELTLPVGLLAVALALLLGAGHALLPGHGKTVMAAYIAGRRGTVRDAVTVGATVTATHTAGVLVLGTTLTVVSGFAGETVLGWLGVGSGVIIAGVGVTLLVAAFTARRHHRPRGADHLTDHDHDHRHDHGHDHGHDGGHDHGDGHRHPPQHGHQHHHHDRPLSRRGLLSMGVAGGLVPSPSALVVLLGAVALGRTWFGILLVVAYGLGMAAVLTAAGLLLVKLRDRVAPAASQRWSRLAGPVTAAMPVLTASLVLAVGLGLAVRGVLPLIGGSL